MRRLLLITIFLSLTTLAKEVKSPHDQVARAHQSSKRVRKKLKINDSFFTKLEADTDLSTGELNQAAKTEHDLIISCLGNDELPGKNRRWLNQYLKIIDRLWDEDKYIGATKMRYTTFENSSEIGESAYGTDVFRDPQNSDQFLIGNFYNMGFKYEVPVIQEGDKLMIKKQILGGMEVSGSGTVSKYGNFILEVEVNDGAKIDKCHMVFSKRPL